MNDKQKPANYQKFKDTLNRLAISWGADLFGVADLSEASRYLEQEFGRSFTGLNRAISLAVSFPREVIEELLQGPTHTYLHYYRVVNVRLDDLALRLTSYLQRQGFRAFPIPSSQRVSRDRLAGIFPHRLAARLAGLGWIGKSGSLVNPVFGPRLRLVTVLTDAPLPADQSIADRCGNCQLCFDVCPAGAITGRAFNPAEELAVRLKPELCDQYQNQVRAQFGKRVCGKCLAVCPYGKFGTNLV